MRWAALHGNGASLDLRSELATNVLLHEEQDTVARHVYYGRDSFWWTKDEAARQPLPWPSGKRE